MLVDGEVALLLGALRDGGAAAIADAAVESLSAMDRDDGDPEIAEPEDENARKSGDDPEEASDEGLPRLPLPEAIRQLDVADEIVLDWLRLEAALISAIPDELGLIREAQFARGDGELFLVETVTISSDAREGPDPEAHHDGTVQERDIADDRALNAVTDLERAWLVASESTRRAIRERG